jgi:hypothetical protein
MALALFLVGLLVVSVLTGLCTEAVKKTLDECGRTYRSNILAGLVSIVVSILVSVAVIVLAGVTITASVVVYIVALIIMSWLCAMIGYDKVVQAISQFKTTKTEE